MTGGNEGGVTVGFWGKLPARGDFVGAGLKEDAIAAFESWSRAAIAASRAELGDGWDERWMSAPIWRFRLGEGVTGRMALAGLWLPSVDSVGRRFPLFIAGDAYHVGDQWLASAETYGLEAVTVDLEPELLAARLRRLLHDGTETAPPPGRSVWWTEGGPYCGPGRFETAMLPAAEMFASMLSDGTGADCDAGHGEGMGAA